MAHRLRRFVCCVFVLAASLSFEGRSDAQAPRFEGERTDVIAVEIPVQVVRDGQPVRGLTAADFTITAGRQKQAITGFEVVDLATVESTAAVSLSPTARRHFLVLFDLSNSEPKSIVASRAAAAKVIENELHPTDLVAVASYVGSKGAQLLLGFTSDRGQVLQAIETLGLPELIDRTDDPLRLVFAKPEVDFETSVSVPKPAVGFGGGSGVARAEALLLDLLKGALDRSEANTRRTQLARLSDYTRNMADLGGMMANVSGRKYVVLLSEGFDSSLMLGSREKFKEDENIDAVEKGQVWKVDSDQRFGSTAAANDLERMVESFRRADCVIQSVDIGGLRADKALGFNRGDGTDGLFAMARDTGGEMYRNFNDLADAMRQMLARTAVTYVLSFQPEVARDGAFHKVNIELNGEAGRGARVVAKPGYFAPKPFDQKDGFSRLLDAADLVMSGRERADFTVAPLAAAFRGVDGKAYVPFFVEIDGKELLRATEGTVLPLEIYAYAIKSDGSIADSLGQTLELDLTKTRSALETRGLKFFGHLELPPGEYSIRVLSRNAKTGASTLTATAVAVPAALFDEVGVDEQPAALVSRPFFPEPMPSWPLVREKPHGVLAAEPYPFFDGQSPFLPASRPTLASGKATQVALVVYDLPEEEELHLRAAVVAADGSVVGDGGAISEIVRASSGESGRDVITASYVPSALKAGSYRLRLSLAVGVGAAIESAEAPFEVR